ncbi:MAG: DUF4203 domain-containing protein [Pirellulaceae bacterium]
MPVVNVILGAVLLFFGRQLYWAFVAVAGFLAAGHFSEVALADQSAWLRLIAALAVGIVGALLAMLAQRLAFALGGFYAGGYLALIAGDALQPGSNVSLWLIVGGVIGAVIAALVMDWAIIILSSLVGSGAIVAVIAADPAICAIVYALLFGLGVTVQARHLRRTRESGEASSSAHG